MTLVLDAIYTDLHRNPELSFQEHRTAGVISEKLTALGIAHTTGIGGTGVVAVIEHGEGPVVWLRADTDGLPVEEATGLPYASRARGTDPSGADVPVMHACGHDMHVTALLGALEKLTTTDASWHGTLVAIFQPAEEFGAGARAMLDEGQLDRFPRPDIVLGQHVSSTMPAGVLGVRAGTQMAAAEGVTIVLHGRGGHGSRPHETIDPVVMAAATVMRLQTIVSREVGPQDVAVLTVGSIRAGLKHNIIPAEAVLEISIRYTVDQQRTELLEKIDRVVRAEAEASGAVVAPTITSEFALPPTINDEAATARVIEALSGAFGPERVIDPGMFTGSEDVSWFARDAGVPLVYWFWGGMDAERFAAAKERGTLAEDIAPNHSPHFAPVIHPTLETGVDALVAAAREFLG